eukprot:m.248777 g.248777  ORF g.248777 m.248777 type:complete len:196 (+) comp40294_c0_seq25:204-791(+)
MSSAKEREEAEKKACDLNSQGMNNYDNGHLEEALVLYRKALSVEDEGRVGQTQTRANTLHQIGLIILDNLNQSEEAERFLRQALEISIKVKGKESERTGITFGVLGGCLVEQGKLDEAEEFLKSAIIAYEKSGSSVESFLAFHLASSLQNLPGKLDEAEALQRKWLPISEKEFKTNSWEHSLSTFLRLHLLFTFT